MARSCGSHHPAKWLPRAEPRKGHLPLCREVWNAKSVHSSDEECRAREVFINQASPLTSGEETSLIHLGVRAGGYSVAQEKLQSCGFDCNAGSSDCTHGACHLSRSS